MSATQKQVRFQDTNTKPQIQIQYPLEGRNQLPPSGEINWHGNDVHYWATEPSVGQDGRRAQTLTVEIPQAIVNKSKQTGSSIGGSRLPRIASNAASRASARGPRTARKSSGIAYTDSYGNITLQIPVKTNTKTAVPNSYRQYRNLRNNSRIARESSQSGIGNGGGDTGYDPILGYRPPFVTLGLLFFDMAQTLAVNIAGIVPTGSEAVGFAGNVFRSLALGRVDNTANNTANNGESATTTPSSSSKTIPIPAENYSNQLPPRFIDNNPNLN